MTSTLNFSPKCKAAKIIFTDFYIKMKCVFREFLFFLFLLCSSFDEEIGFGIKRSCAAAPKPEEKEETKPVRPVYGYRTVPWCVTGKDEPELHSWPFSQFVPLLRRTSRFHHDKDFRYTITFNEITTQQLDIGRSGGLFKSIHIILKAEKRKNYTLSVYEKWAPHLLEGLIIQANYNPQTLGLPAGEFFSVDGQSDMDGVKCTDCDRAFWGDIIPCRKRAVIHMKHPTIVAFHHEMLPAGYKTWDDKAGLRSELHVNFRWYSPLCAETRRLLFYVMAVRSFSKNEYDVLELGPYEVTIRDQGYQSDFVPSPYFEFFTMQSECHIRSSTDIQTLHPFDTSKAFQEFEMSSRYDCCTKNEDNPNDPDPLKRHSSHKIESSYNCNATNVGNPKTIAFGTESRVCSFPPNIKSCSFITQEREGASDYNKKCEPCVTLAPTTLPPVTPSATGLMKRSTHGLLMIVTNFCLQPIVIFVARFYKETFNQHSFKGVKLWYWMHMLGGMVSSLVSYFGYFSGGEQSARVEHTVLGNTYIMLLALCYVTAWGRHKNIWITTIAELLHAGLGYTVIIMAIASVSTSRMGEIPKIFCYLMAVFQILFTITQTCHICLWDRKIGMKPSRRHLPTVEARFDTIRVPGSTCRVIMLLMFSVITVTLCVASTFFE